MPRSGTQGIEHGTPMEGAFADGAALGLLCSNSSPATTVSVIENQ